MFYYLPKARVYITVLSNFLIVNDNKLSSNFNLSNHLSLSAVKFKPFALWMKSQRDHSNESSLTYLWCVGIY